MFKKIFMMLFLLLTGACLFAMPAGAEQMTDAATFTPANALLTDGNEGTYSTVRQGSSIRISAPKPIASLYIVFDRTPAEWTLRAGDSSFVCGTYGFLHEYVDVAGLVGAASEVELTFDRADAQIADIYVFSEGELPDWVQRWKPAEGEADLMLLPTHADDDHLFFLGILPYYAGECGYEVQVVYFTNHWAVHDRPHELLNGLWTTGVTRYPVISALPDGWDGQTKNKEYAYNAAKWAGFSKDDLIAFQVEMLRRFRPQVVVGHDINGEYGHPQHMANTDTLIAALELSADASYSPETASTYGVWDVPKTYLHLYGEHTVTMNWDVPLSRFGGKTAYEVSKLGYACHKSQQYTWFTRWVNGRENQFTKATDITSYRPTDYGLYRTTVGYDTKGGDFFENLTVRSTIPPETEPVTEPETDPATEPETAPVTGPETGSTQGEVTDTAAAETAEQTEGRSKKQLFMLLLLAFLTALLIAIVWILAGQLHGAPARGRRRRSGRRR